MKNRKTQIGQKSSLFFMTDFQINQKRTLSLSFYTYQLRCEGDTNLLFSGNSFDKLSNARVYLIENHVQLMKYDDYALLPNKLSPKMTFTRNTGTGKG